MNKNNIKNDAYDDMCRYSRSLKRCNRIYDKLGIVYAGFALLYAVIAVDAITSPEKFDLIPILLDGFLFKAGTLVFGYMSCYKKRNFYALCNIMTLLLSIFMAFTGTTACGDNNIYIAFYAALEGLLVLSAFVVMAVNKRYRFLEEQPGFPYFSQRVEEIKFDAVQNKIKTDYQQSYERWKKTSSGSMNGTEDENKMMSADLGFDHLPSSGIMDEI